MSRRLLALVMPGQEAAARPAREARIETEVFEPDVVARFEPPAYRLVRARQKNEANASWRQPVLRAIR